MKRPAQPTGEALGATMRLNPVTHPTQVIRRLVRHEEQKGVSPAFLRGCERVSVLLLVGGPFVVGLGLTGPSVPVVILGMTVISAGFCLIVLRDLLLPERLGWDVRLLEWMRARADR